jgi:hypothetical protein
MSHDKSGKKAPKFLPRRFELFPTGANKKPGQRKPQNPNSNNCAEHPQKQGNAQSIP